MTKEDALISDLTIKPLRTEDATGIRKMQADVWADIYPNEKAEISRQWVVDCCVAKWFSPEAARATQEHFEDIINNPDIYYYRVVLDKNKVLGNIFLSKINDVQCLESLYLDKTLRGKKIAQKLLDDALGWTDNKKPIVLEVASYNNRAIAFYKKYGFEVEEGSEHLFANKIPIISMIKKGEI